ncbi:Suppressor protein SRP40 [Caenorhabditis elegans]|uniref:Suppressor protein SRP40 n=1 Tax=Caenorhabditis elegans TaxID=6239 RepID=Q8I4L0_CAEEL|nr:Suppressor protein SRP40 [Caenorhabditis elegans]CAD56568.1 Suppressor protein SRP40 [Caenorhabditis elegans]|eukprot:NP_872240.1 Uncharacterized protein CELE_F15G9.1 [Caenorhabditis elegans]
MSSRYTSSYTPSSRYGSGWDYSSSYSSSRTSRDRDTGSYRDRDYSSTSYTSTRPRYSTYASKYSTDLGKSTDRMDDYSAAPIAKDEIEELSYDAKTPTTPTEETVDAPREVLQESQISDFVEEDDDQQTEVEEVKLTLASEPEESEEEEDDEDVRKAQELLAASTQIRESSPVSSPVKEVSSAASLFANDNGNETENRTPSPTVLNAKKLGGIPWPPKSSDVKKEGGDAEALPKKRVSDLIARFNTGVVEESKKTDDAYKNEYGAGTNVGKVSTHNFA